MRKMQKTTLKQEYELLDNALAYWGNEKLHDILERWYIKLKNNSKEEVE